MFQPNRTVSKSKIDTLDLTERVSVEAEITDARAAALDRERLVALNTDLANYSCRYAWRRFLFNFLGSVDGKVMLDIACGYSMTPVMFALAGATVHALDVAPKTLAMVQYVAQCKGVAERVHIHVGPAEELPFEDASFDLIYGGAALHHLQLDRAGRELARVLKCGGKGAFQDPLAHNPVLEFTRDYLAYRGKHPVKGTDRPLHLHEVQAFGRHFTTCTYQGFELFSLVAKAFRLKRTARVRRLLEATDDALLPRLPILQHYARFVVTCVTKECSA
jgi:ubiquinone/menaquinone biosynthesis C-methylase UbiE